MWPFWWGGHFTGNPSTRENLELIFSFQKRDVQMQLRWKEYGLGMQLLLQCCLLRTHLQSQCIMPEANQRLSYALQTPNHAQFITVSSSLIPFAPTSQEGHQILLSPCQPSISPLTAPQTYLDPNSDPAKSYKPDHTHHETSSKTSSSQEHRG